MHRIDGPGATADNKFTEGDPVAGVPATVVTDDFMNDVQEEIISVLSAASITPVKGTQNQLLAAITKLARALLGNYSAYQLVTGSAPLTAGKMYLVTAAGVTPTLPVLASSVSGDTVTVAARVDTTIAVGGAGLINNPAFGSTTSILLRAGEQIQFVSNGSNSWQISNYSKNPQYQADTAFTTAGTAAALTLTPIPPIPGYATNLRFRVKFTQDSTPTSTINVSALGVKLLKQYDAVGAKVPAVYATNQLSDIEYDGTDFVLLNQLPPAADLLNTVRSNVASAATVNLTTSAALTRHINITGTTNISAFTVAAGQCYFVRFDASLTLVNSTALVTQSGANIVTQAGDTCMLRVTSSGNVEVLCYTPFKNQALGYEQTTQDMTASRAVGSSYTNSTGKTIDVSIVNALNTNWIASVVVAGQEVFRQVTNNMTSGGQTTIRFLVLPGQTYSLATLTGTTITKWWETR